MRIQRNRVKIKGVRIELDAIERHMLDYPGIILVASRAFDDDNERILDYIARVHQKLEPKVPAGKYKAYLALFQQEPSVFAARDMDDLLHKRFGAAGAREIWDSFHNTWITETDFQLARAIGFNFVRVPFWYRWLESETTPYTYSEYGFRYLDRAVAWAREQGLYVMLDYHGAQGCQSPWDHTGELSHARFFSDPECQRRCAALWKAIADRYKSNPNVFAYDLLNEPFSAKDTRNWTEAHDLIYDAIRSVDARARIGISAKNRRLSGAGTFPRNGLSP